MLRKLTYVDRKMIRKSPLKYTERDDQAMERSLLLFENSVKSKITFREYLKRLEKFRQFCNADSFDSLSKIESAKLQEMLEDHIMLRKTDQTKLNSC